MSVLLLKNNNNKSMKNIDLNKNFNELLFKRHINDKGIYTLIDTGANDNFINQKLVKKLNIEIKNITPIEIMFGNKTIANKNSEAHFNMTIDSFSHKVFKIKAFITPIANNFVLGTSWLKDTNCILNFKENTMSLDNSEAELPLYNSNKKIIKKISDKTNNLRKL
ncbi:hypothetical protein DMUE_3096 [Dictyocoela muelleri]|nr:hypothetical protein DMUE_3096 [Dictyocoela muelleri]